MLIVLLLRAPEPQKSPRAPFAARCFRTPVAKRSFGRLLQLVELPCQGANLFASTV